MLSSLIELLPGLVFSICKGMLTSLIDLLGGFVFDIWTIVGLVGQGIFGSRFFVQWIASEKRKESYIPIAFWWLSLTGSLILSVYFIYRQEVVGIAGSVPNSFVYIRNLQLIRKRARAALPVVAPPAPGGQA